MEQSRARTLLGLALVLVGSVLLFRTALAPLGRFGAFMGDDRSAAWSEQLERREAQREMQEAQQEALLSQQEAQREMQEAQREITGSASGGPRRSRSRPR